MILATIRSCFLSSINSDNNSHIVKKTITSENKSCPSHLIIVIIMLKLVCIWAQLNTSTLSYKKESDSCVFGTYNIRPEAVLLKSLIGYFHS